MATMTPARAAKALKTYIKQKNKLNATSALIVSLLEDLYDLPHCQKPHKQCPPWALLHDLRDPHNREAVDLAAMCAVEYLNSCDDTPDNQLYAAIQKAMKKKLSDHPHYTDWDGAITDGQILLLPVPVSEVRDYIVQAPAKTSYGEDYPNIKGIVLNALNSETKAVLLPKGYIRQWRLWNSWENTIVYVSDGALRVRRNNPGDCVSAECWLDAPTGDQKYPLPHLPTAAFKADEITVWLCNQRLRWLELRAGNDTVSILYCVDDDAAY